MAGLHRISCISAALGAGARGGSVGGLVPAPKNREMSPKTEQVQTLGLEDSEPSFGLEMINGAGLPRPKLRGCWRQVSVMG